MLGIRTDMDQDAAWYFGSDTPTRHVAAINKAWEKFKKTKDKRFDHIEMFGKKILIALFTYEVPVGGERRTIHLPLDQEYLYHFVFPLGKIIQSDDPEFKVDDIIGIPTNACQIRQHPEWTKYRSVENQRPEPMREPLHLPEWTRAVDIPGMGWYETRYIDPFVELKKTDRLHILRGHDLGYRYNGSKLNDLKSLCNAKIAG